MMPSNTLRIPASPSMVAAKSSQPKPFSSNSYASSRVTVATAFPPWDRSGETLDPPPDEPRLRVRQSTGCARPSSAFHPLVTTPGRRRRARLAQERGGTDVHCHDGADRVLGRRSGAAARPAQGSRQRRAEADGARAPPAVYRSRARARSTRSADPPGLLLRHARARSRRTRSRRPRETYPGQRRRLDRQAAPGRAERAARGAAAFRRVPRRGGRASRRVRLLRNAQGLARRGRCAPRGEGGAPSPEALLEGAAGAVHGARATGDRPRRPHRPRADLRPQAAPRPARPRAQARGGDVDLPGRLPHPRAVHARCDERGVPGRGRDTCLPRRARRRPLGRAGNEDPQGTRVLRTGASGEVLSSRAPAVPGAASVAGIVPRWEWRTFGENFGAAEGLLDLREAERVQERDELYLLSQESDASVKVRDGLMDVKRLEAVDGNGLEQWRAVLTGLFPLGAADLRTVLDALGVSPPDLTREAYTLDQLVDEVVGASPALAAVAVHKRRVHYRLGDCMAELSEVTAGTRSARTIAVEAEDPELVAATVRELQLAERPNVCLARGLKTMLGLEPVRFAVIDVGTNSVKLHVGERRADGSWQTVADRAEVTRLGEGLQETGSLQPEPLRRTADAVV